MNLIQSFLDLFLSKAIAADAYTINPNLPGINAAKGPLGILADFYTFALATSAILAFGLIIYAALQMAIKGANSSSVADARDQITQALVGLALLLGAFFILYIINPGLTSLTLPVLENLDVKKLSTEGEGAYLVGLGDDIPEEGAPGTGGGGTRCTVCQESPIAKAVRQCVEGMAGGVLGQITTYGGSHKSGSCHFGGSTCNDGSHAIDFGGKAGAGGEPNAGAIKNAMAACAAQKNTSQSCFCEGKDTDGKIKRFADCNDSRVDHLHCNIGSCGCN